MLPHGFFSEDTELMPFTRVRNRMKERLGLVIKEDGVVKKFEIIDLTTW